MQQPSESEKAPESRVEMSIILTSASSEEEGKQLATGLVEGGLAACVQISSPGLSIYPWDGAIQQDREHYLTIKTSNGSAPKVIAWLTQHHPYDLPEIVRIKGSSTDAYLQWLSEQKG